MNTRLVLTSFVALAAAFCAWWAVPGAAQDAKKPAEVKVTYEAHIKPFLDAYCLKCHSGDRPRADLSLEGLSGGVAAQTQRELWDRVAHVVHTGEMPPRNKPQPSAPEKERLARWVEREVNKIDCDLPADPGRVTLRRLNRAEYNNTIRDLLAVKFRPADDFPSDDVGYGFDNIGDVLTLSPLLLEKYLAAAEQVVNEAWKEPVSRNRILTRNPDSAEDVRAILRSFAGRAYRRPARDDEVERLARFVDLARKNGDSNETGVKLAVQAVLVSPHFLFRVERDRDPEPGQQGHKVSEYELASRLSYFLWSSMPDRELFDLAEQKQLRANQDAQIRRMLASPKAKALVDNFAGQWLHLRNLRLKAVNPDPDRFPTFNDDLRAAMIRETELFFETVVKEDRSVLEFLDADWTFVNEPLARHYGIPGVKGPEFRKVTLKDDRRGGLLTQASILTVTSMATRTSPVVRGKWILENILNAPPPAPPPEVPELPNDDKAVASGSLRQRMELHRSNALCASCHERLDPIGFALENYDAIGRWRDKDGKFPIDASGVLPGGQSFAGPKDLRQVLSTAKADDFRRCLAEKMLTYALGRGLEFYDRCAVNDICDALEARDDKFSSLVTAIVHSEPFQMRRGKRGNP